MAVGLCLGGHHRAQRLRGLERLGRRAGVAQGLRPLAAAVVVRRRGAVDGGDGRDREPVRPDVAGGAAVDALAGSRPRPLAGAAARRRSGPDALRLTRTNAMPVLGLAVGGANLKAAHPAGCRSLRFPLWKEPRGLSAALRRLTAGLPFDRVAVTMTGELCDC